MIDVKDKAIQHFPKQELAANVIKKTLHPVCNLISNNKIVVIPFFYKVVFFDQRWIKWGFYKKSQYLLT